MRLPEHLRVTLYLADVEGYSYREIAAITGTALNIVNSRLTNARRRLRALIVTHQQCQRVEDLAS